MVQPNDIGTLSNWEHRVNPDTNPELRQRAGWPVMEPSACPPPSRIEIVISSLELPSFKTEELQAEVKRAVEMTLPRVFDGARVQCLFDWEPVAQIKVNFAWHDRETPPYGDAVPDFQRAYKIVRYIVERYKEVDYQLRAPLPIAGQAIRRMVPDMTLPALPPQLGQLGRVLRDRGDDSYLVPHNSGPTSAPRPSPRTRPDSGSQSRTSTRRGRR